MITLFTDAAYCETTKLGGYGAWCKADGWQRGVFFGGKIKNVLNSSECELAGVMKALISMNRDGVLALHDEIFIQCDNVRALSALLSLAGSKTKAFVKRSKDPTDVCIQIQPIRRKTENELHMLSILRGFVEGKTLFLRHVKGHNKKESSRGNINKICDKIARENLVRSRRDNDADSLLHL